MNSQVSYSHTTRKRSSFRRKLALLGALLGFAAVPLQGQTWNGAAGTTNWSDPGNWNSFAIPTAGDTVLFDPYNTAAASGVVDNIVDQNFSIYGLMYQTPSTVGYHTTFMSPGVSLAINSSGGNAIYVGTGASVSGGQSIYSRWQGFGWLNVTNTTGVISVVQGGDNNDHYATLDLSALTNFNASLGQLFVGCIADTATYGLRPMGILRLAETNFIQTAAGAGQPGIMVACYPTSDTNRRGTQQLFLGRHNIINSDAISVGGTKMTGQIRSRPGVSDGYALLRGSAGGSDKVKILSIGDGRAGMSNYGPGSTSSASSGTLDATGTFLDAVVQDLYVARSQTNNNGATTGVLAFDRGTIVADNLYVGYHPSPAASSGSYNGTGTINLSGTATLTVNNDAVLARKVGGTTPVATLNLSDSAVLNIKGNLISGGGTSAIDLSDGALINLQPTGDATPGFVSISSLSGNGTITNALSVTNAASVTPGATSAAGTLAVFGDYTLASNATMNVNLTNVVTPGSGLNDLISVHGNLNLNSNVVNLSPIASTLASGPYRLIDYTGTRSGYLNLSNSTRYNLALDYSTDKQVNLSVLGGAPANLQWNSLTSAAWDLTASNFLNTGSSSADRFFQYDNVLVDASGSFTNLLLLNGTLTPGSVTVNSSSRDYSFGGSGKLSGGAAILKQGTSTLTISNANDFLGPVVISDGTLRIANSAALGSTAGGTFVTNGGTLDLSGSTDNDWTTISGVGLNNTGAVINTGSRADNGIRLLSLAGNASVGTWGLGRWDVRGAGGSQSLSGLLQLNGYILTKLGPTQLSLVDLVATNAGSIEVAGGFLALTRSKIDGPGYINAFSNTVHLENNSTGYVTKPMIFNGGTLRASGNPFELWSPVTNLANMTIDNSVTFTLTNLVTGPGSLTKVNAGNLVLQALNYTGPTTVSAGQLTIGTNASLASTAAIGLGSGTNFAILDITALPGGLALAGGQSLSGSGIILGDVTAGPTTSVTPGNSAGTLVFSNNLTLNGISSTFELDADPNAVGGFINDLIAVNGTLNLSGLNTIKIAPLATLDTTAPYTLFQYNSLIGGLGNLSITSDSRYSFTPSINSGTFPPSIQVSVTGSGSSADLVWAGVNPTNPTRWDTKVTSNWLNGVSLDTFYLGDNVQFDDTASTSSLTIPADVHPAAVVLNNSGKSYSFSGAGALAAGSLTKNGTGSLTFSNSAANSVSGATVINEGTVTLANSDANAFFGAATINAGTLNINNAGEDSFAQALNVNGGTVVFDQAADTTFASALADSGVSSGTVQKAGANTLWLSGNNANFNGPILVSSGVLKAGNPNALGSAVGGTTIASGAMLDVYGTALYNPGDDITISGNGIGGLGAIINTGAGQNNALRSVILAADASIGAWVTRFDIRGPGGSGSFSGLLNLNGHTLKKLGPAQNSIVDSDVTAAGNIEIDGGLISVTRCNVAGDGYINIRTNTLEFENYTSGYFMKPLVSSGGTLAAIGNAFTCSSPITNLAGLTINNSVNLTLQGPIVGPAPLSKSGTAAAILTALDNAWSVGTTINAGTLQIGSGTSDGSLPDLPVVDNGTLFINSMNPITLTKQISGIGGLAKRGEYGMLTLTSSNTFTGGVTTGTGAVPQQSGGIIRIQNSSALGDGSVFKLVDIVRSELQLDGSLVLPTNLTLRTSTADLDFAGAGLVAVRSLSGNSTLQGPIILTSGGGSSVLQVDAGQLTLNGDITADSTGRTLILGGVAPGIVNGALTNNGSNIPSLEKRDSGTWTLNAANTFTGNTTIKGGTLVLGVAASISSSAIIDVQGGAILSVAAVSGFALGTSQTLEGNGAISGNVTADGTVAPGEGTAGALTFSAGVVLSATSSNLMELDKLNGTNDVINAASIAFGGNLVVTEISGTPFAAGDSFKLFNAPNKTGSFSSISLPPLGDPSLAWDTSSLLADGTIRVGTAARLSFTVSGNTLDISWPSAYLGAQLQSQTNTVSVGLTGTWYPVQGSTLTNRMIMNIDSTKGTVFFRLAPAL